MPFVFILYMQKAKRYCKKQSCDLGALQYWRQSNIFFDILLPWFYVHKTATQSESPKCLKLEITAIQLSRPYLECSVQTAWVVSTVYFLVLGGLRERPVTCLKENFPRGPSWAAKRAQLIFSCGLQSLDLYAFWLPGAPLGRQAKAASEFLGKGRTICFHEDSWMHGVMLLSSPLGSTTTRLYN